MLGSTRVVLLLVTAAAAVDAQGTSLALGTRIRVTAAEAGTGVIEGTLETLTRDSIVIRERPRRGSSAESRRMAWNDVAGIERFAGSRRRTGQSAAKGALVGSLLGLAVSAQARGKPGERCDTEEPAFILCEMAMDGFKALGTRRTTLAFGTAGVIIGALAGREKRDRWVKATESAWRPEIGMYSQHFGEYKTKGVKLRWHF
jgi:hypothetical protein